MSRRKKKILPKNKVVINEDSMKKDIKYVGDVLDKIEFFTKEKKPIISMVG